MPNLLDGPPAVFYKENKFVDTEAGKIPVGWQLRALGDKDMIQLGNGERPQIAEHGGYPVFGASGIMGTSDGYLVDSPSTLVIGRVGASGEIRLAKGKVWISDNAIYTKSYNRSTVNILYLYYLLTASRLKRYATKSTHPIITKGFLDSFKVAIPPISEQESLAEVLSTVDLSIEKTGEVIAKLERIKKGLMQELLTKGLGHKEFKQAEIGKVPKEWEVVKLGDILDNIRYGTSVRAILGQKGVPILGIPNVLGGEIEESGLRYAIMTEQETRDLALKDGDILLVRTNANPDYIGRCALFSERQGTWAFASYLIRMRPKLDRVLPSYLLRYLQSSVARKRFLSIARTSAGNYNINTKGIQSIVVPLPNIREQERISEVLVEIDDGLHVEREGKVKLNKIKQGLMDSLLTGKVRIKVN